MQRDEPLTFFKILTRLKFLMEIFFSRIFFNSNFVARKNEKLIPLISNMTIILVKVLELEF